FQTAQVIVDGVKEVQAIWSRSADLGPIAGPIIGALLTAVAVGRTVLAIQKINAAKFERGVLIQNWDVVNRYARGGTPPVGADMPAGERRTIWNFWKSGTKYEQGGTPPVGVDTPAGERRTIWNFWKSGTKYEQGGTPPVGMDTPVGER